MENLELLDRYLKFKFVEKQLEGVQKMMVERLEVKSRDSVQTFIKLQKEIFEEVLRENNIKLS